MRTDRAHQIAARRNRRADSRRLAAKPSSRRPTSRTREQVLAAVETVERELGPISVLINNAGAYLRKRSPKLPKRISTSSSRSIAYGPFFCTQAVVGKMAERGDGTIIFVLGSETRGGPAQYSAYNASKLAQRAIAESWRTSSCIWACMPPRSTWTARWTAAGARGDARRRSVVTSFHRQRSATRSCI